MSFILFIIGVTVLSYPFFGAVIYGDPWTWLFKENKQ